MRFAIIPDVRMFTATADALKRGITHLVIHHSATKAGDAEAFYRFHTDPEPQGRGWADIGYHAVVPNGVSKPNGIIQLGRDLDNDNDVFEHQGAGVLGMNRHTLHICGTGNFDETEPDPQDLQIRTIAILSCQIMRIFNIPVHRVIGHREAGAIEGVPKVHKTCPGSKIDCNQMRDFFNFVDRQCFDDWANDYQAYINQLRENMPGLKILDSGG